MFEAVEWCFFDLGGTLIDKSRQEDYIIKKILIKLREQGNDCNYQEFVEYMKQGAAQYFEPVKYAVDKVTSNQNQMNDIMAEVEYKVELGQVYQGADETLEYLSKKYKLGIIANQRMGAEKRMKYWGIHHYFSQFFLSAELGVSKPNPQIFKMALNSTRCNPSNAIMIGDKVENDVYPPKLLGMNTIRVLQGFSALQQPKSIEYIADITIPGIRKLMEIL